MRTVPRRYSLALLVAVAAAFAAPAAAHAAEGQIIVKYAAGADAGDRSDAREAADVVRRSALPLARTEVVAPERGTSVAAAVAELERSPDVVYAEPDRPRAAFDETGTTPEDPTGTTPDDPTGTTPDDPTGTTPVDPSDPTPTEPADPGPVEPPADVTSDEPGFADQWALKNTGLQQIFFGPTMDDWYLGTPGDDINVEPAWNLETEAVPTVAVIDSGVDLTHPDLAGNIVPGGKDYVDGDDKPQDQNGHGTHVAGTIGAVGDNHLGVTGVAWKAHLLPIRVLDANGEGSVSTVLQGEQYAAAHAGVVNLSLGGAWPSQAEYDALRNATNTLFVVAAGNDHANVDATDSYPCAYNLPNVICVAATGGHDELASFSNYGANTVDIAAPGVDILSTYPMAKPTSSRRGYEWLSGTSMATPEVAGAAALVLSHDETLSPWQVSAKLMEGADQVEGLQGKVSSGGRLDVLGAMNATAPPAGDQPRAADRAPNPRQATKSAPATPTQPTTPSVPYTPPATATPVTTTPKTTTPVTTSKPVDRAAPVLTAALSGRHGLKLLLGRRLKASATTSERATVRFELRIDGRTAKTLHLAKTSAAAVRIATGTASLKSAGTKAGTLRLTSAAKRALARVRSVKVTLRATATDAAGNARTRSRTVTLTS